MKRKKLRGTYSFLKCLHTKLKFISFVWIVVAALFLSISIPAISYAWWTNETIDSSTYVGEYPSITVDTNNKVHISYRDYYSGLKYATTDDAGSWVTSTADSTYFVGFNTSIAVDSINNIHISYRDYYNGYLNYVMKDASGTWEIPIIIDQRSETNVNVWNTSIAVDSNDKVHISYYDYRNGYIKYATNTSGSWEKSNVCTGRDPSIAVNSNNKVHISYYDSTNGDLNYVTNATGSWVKSTLDSTGCVGLYNSIAVDSNNKVHISYYDYTNGDLKYVTNATGSWLIRTPDSKGNVGQYTSIAVDSENKVHVSYYDVSNRDLKYAKYFDSTPPIVAGSAHSIALKSDGTLWGWGHNHHGQLGDGTGLHKFYPARIGDADGDGKPDNDWISISAGDIHNLARKSDGSLWAWGWNDYGQIGDGTRVLRETPVRIGNDNDWVSVVAGRKHNVAIKSDGSLWTWGQNLNGKLGIGTEITDDQLVPVQVGSDNDWFSVSAGREHTVALKSNGTIWAWGGNGVGQVGVCNTQGKPVYSPIQIGGSTDWVNIATGDGSTYAIKADGTLWAWGGNGAGQIGNGTTYYTEGLHHECSPVLTGDADVDGVPDNDWLFVASWGEHTLAIKTNGSLWGWGGNPYGSLGVGDTDQRHIPTHVGDETDTWISVAAGYHHSLGIKSDGTWWGWGWNGQGRVGNGTTEYVEFHSPVQTLFGGGSIGISGGEIITWDEKITIQIPVGALNTQTFISITETGDTYELTTNQGTATALYGINIEPEGQVFNIPITIIFQWFDSDDNGEIDGTNISENNLIITKDGVTITNTCGNDPINCDITNNTFSIEVDSLSVFTLAVLNGKPTIEEIDASLDPIIVNSRVDANATFTDNGFTDAHTAIWYWGDETASIGTVIETGGSGSIEGRHTYGSPGVFTITLTVTDDNGESGTSDYKYVVVYDPDGGFVTGGGWIESPLGAYVPDPSLIGKANFGFVSKYKKGSTVPTGNTEFQFKVANLNFHSDIYEWLVIAGAKAMYKGIGTINGEGEYKFMLTGIDADINEDDSFDIDRFRIKIWTEDEFGEEVVYDNALGDDSDEATTEIGGGSIVIHKK